MFTIHLNNLIFFAYHGLHDEERILGGEFEVNAAIGFDAAGKVSSLKQTVDYTEIFEVIKQRMHQPTALLETLVQELVHNIYQSDRRITWVDINLKKMNPPIGNFQGSVTVSYKHQF